MCFTEADGKFLWQLAVSKVQGEADYHELGICSSPTADGNRVLLLDPRDTSFAGTSDEVTDDEVISAIKSVPCHY